MQEKADSELVRRQNRHIVLRALRNHGALARVQLGRITGLSPASITSIASQLIAENILQELQSPLPIAATTKRGRPITRLDLKPEASHVLAANISIDRISLAIANFRGNILHRTTLHVPTYKADKHGFGTTVAVAINDFLKVTKTGLQNIARIGVAVQGLADMNTGTLLWSPAFEARNIALAGPLQAHFKLPCLVANDANMIAEGFLSRDMAEWTHELPAARNGITATIFTGYGVGMGLIIDGEVYHGATGGASEFGHMNHIPHGALCRCGRRGCIEAYAADYGIWRHARGHADDAAPHGAIDPLQMTELFEAARNGEPRAVAAFQQAGEALGFGIARLIAILNPNRVVIAGPGLSASTIIEPSLREGIASGVIEELRKNVSIEFVPFETDMILRGTIDALLRAVDGDITAHTQSAMAVA